MRATEVDIITRNGGTCRIPDETLVKEAKELGAIVDRHPHLVPLYAQYAHHMSYGGVDLARVSAAFIRSYAHI